MRYFAIGLLLMILVIGCAKKAEKYIKCKYCKNEILKTLYHGHKSGITVDGKYYHTCWEELRRIIRKHIDEIETNYSLKEQQ